jgi:ABC-type lipoprotein export system ATPase subunit
MDKIVLEAKNIFKSYSNGNKQLIVLNNLSLKLKKAEIIAITGESGCGKSTILNILGTLDKYEKGVLKIDSMDIKGCNDNKLSKIRNEKIGFVFQSYHLLPEFTAIENVLMPAWIKNDNKSEERAEKIFKDLGLQSRKDHYPNQLSGGEKARVSVIRAIINRPKVLLADEPTGNLDRVNSDKLLNLFMRINKEYNQAIILTTHNQDVANFAHRILRLENGMLI